MCVDPFPCSSNDPWLTLTALNTITGPIRNGGRILNSTSEIFLHLLGTSLSRKKEPLNQFLYPGPGCSKLKTLLVNVSLKFQTLISEICQYFFLKKCEKLLNFSHFFNKNISVVGYKVIKHLSSWQLNEPVKLTMVGWLVVFGLNGPLRCCACSRCGWGWFGHFFLSSVLSLFFLPLFGRWPDIDWNKLTMLSTTGSRCLP